MKNITNAQQIKDIIVGIPAEEFTTHVYSNSRNQCCLFGHINKKICGDPFKPHDAFGAREITAKFLFEKLQVRYIDGSDVNNGRNINGYTEPQIKDRLIHLVNDMIASGY